MENACRFLVESFSTMPDEPHPRVHAHRVVESVKSSRDAAFQVVMWGLHCCHTTWTGMASSTMHRALSRDVLVIPDDPFPERRRLDPAARRRVQSRYRDEFRAAYAALTSGRTARRFFRHPEDTFLDDRDADDLFSRHMARIRAANDVVRTSSCPPASVRVVTGAGIESATIADCATHVRHGTSWPKWGCRRLMARYGDTIKMLEKK